MEFLAEADAYSAGCMMLSFDLPNAKSIAKSFSPVDLSDGGVETFPHVTLLYGIDKAYSIPEMVECMVACRDIVGTSSLVLDDLSLFSSEEHDVLKYSVHDKRMADVNGYLVGSLRHQQQEHEYSPHCTLAYLKPGLGDKYVKRLKAGGFGSVSVEAKFLVYSGADGQKTFLSTNR